MKIKFFITPVYPYGDDHYYHEIIALAEGFRELGHEVFSNHDYWFIPGQNQFLLKGSKSTDYQLGIYDYRYARSFEHLLFRKGFPNFPPHAKHVLIDRNDGISPIWELNKTYLRAYDLIFSGNLFISKSYPLKVKPWAIGITSRQMKYLDVNSGSELKDQIGYNFRVGHNMRKIVFNNLQSSDIPFQLVNEVTHAQQEVVGMLNEDDTVYNNSSTGRHHPQYFNKLNTNLLFLTFGGYLEYRPIRYRPYNLEARFSRKLYHLRAKLQRALGLSDEHNYLVYQQDNFRFWEALFSNTCPISLETERWDYRLPETPINGIHYIGITDLKCSEVSDMLNKLTREEIKMIGSNGRQWVSEHYSPAAQALRALNYIK
jgi:hypothetical protein